MQKYLSEIRREKNDIRKPICRRYFQSAKIYQWFYIPSYASKSAKFYYENYGYPEIAPNK